MEGSDRRWRGTFAGGGERSQVEGSGLSDRWWRGAGAVSDGEQSQMETVPAVGRVAVFTNFIFTFSKQPH